MTERPLSGPTEPADRHDRDHPVPRERITTMTTTTDHSDLLTHAHNCPSVNDEGASRIETVHAENGVTTSRCLDCSASFPPPLPSHGPESNVDPVAHYRNALAEQEASK